FAYADKLECAALTALERDRAAHQPELSVCMIVKNEEQVLRRCLESVRPIARQVVVLDTGSTDRTKAIAAELRAEGHHYAAGPEFDFAAARNASLAHAQCDWILTIDADECLLPATAERIRQLVEQGLSAAYNVDVRRYIEDPASDRCFGNDWVHPDA